MKNVYGIIDQFYRNEPELKDLLIKHSQKVTNKALHIAERHLELNADKQFLFEAAMLHDIGIIHTNAPSILCNGTEPYIKHGILGAEMLRSLNMPLHARVCERHTGTGLKKEEIIARKLPLPALDFIPESIEEQIICYADKFFSKSKNDLELSSTQVLESISKFGKEGVDVFLYWDNLFK
ncbi:MAG: HDIG domain-containing metalloprotein [Bacteroidales bacterium]